MTVAEKSAVAQRLNKSGIENFSIDGNYFIVSIIDFNEYETDHEREMGYAKAYKSITTPFRGVRERVGANKVRDVQDFVRKSRYVGARNEGNEQSQTREYDRHNLFEAQVGTTPTVNEGGSSTINEIDNIDSGTRPPSLKESTQSNNIRFSILGEKGAEALDKFDEATHRMDNLSVARQMEEAEKTEKEIRLTTGWKRGMNNGVEQAMSLIHPKTFFNPISQNQLSRLLSMLNRAFGGRVNVVSDWRDFLRNGRDKFGFEYDNSIIKKMMVGGKETEVRTLPQVTKGFYSPIEKKLLDEKATNLSATKWLERLGKGDEMQFTGLKEFLESKKPNEQVKKSELQDFMRDNRIEVVEVVKGKIEWKQKSKLPVFKMKPAYQ